MTETEMMSGFTVLMADDVADDRFLMKHACMEIRSCGDLHFVEDGNEEM